MATADATKDFEQFQLQKVIWANVGNAYEYGSVIYKAYHT